MRSAGTDSSRPLASVQAILITGAGFTPPAALAGHLWGGAPAALSVALGAVLATLSALGGGWLQARVMPMPPQYFLAAVVGGFLGRMILFGAALVAVVRLTELPVAAFVAALFVFYFVFQFLEIRAAHRRRALPVPSR